MVETAGDRAVPGRGETAVGDISEESFIERLKELDAFRRDRNRTWFSNNPSGIDPLPEPALEVLPNAKFYLDTTFFFAFPPYAVDELEVARTKGASLQGVVTPSTFGGAVGELPYIEVTQRVTDIATVPKLLWGFMASYGKQTLPALLHDQLCDNAGDKKKDGQKAEAYKDRRFADNLFRHALRATGVDPFRRWNFWAGVTFGRYLSYRLPMLLVAAALAAVASVIFYVGLGLIVIQVLPNASVPEHLTGWLAWADNDVWRWLWGGLRPWVLMAIPFVLASVLRYERLWALVYVGTYILIPVGALAALGAVVAIWVRLIPAGLVALVDLLPWVHIDHGPIPWKFWDGATTFK